MPPAVNRDLTLDPTVAAPAQARRTVREVVGGTGSDSDSDLVDTTQLLVSELVTNALTHGRGPITLHVSYDRECVEVEVGDLESDMPVVRPGLPLALGGRGLRMVETLAEQWGVRPRPDVGGKIIWFRLVRP